MNIHKNAKTNKIFGRETEGDCLFNPLGVEPIGGTSQGEYPARRRADFDLGNLREDNEGGSSHRLRPKSTGKIFRQSLLASNRRLAEFAAERESLLAQLDLLNIRESNERTSIEENQQLLKEWEDSISSVFPINNQDAIITTN